MPTEKPISDGLLYNPRDKETINNPLPVLKKLQEEDPVYWSDVLRGWIITRYDDVKMVLRNESFSADRITPFYDSLPRERQIPITELIRYLNTWVAFRDPPEHTRLRKLMRSVFSPQMIAEIKPVVVEAVDELLAPLQDRGEFDFISEFAYPLPAIVILKMLGLPSSDMEDLKDWSSKMQLFIGSATTSPDKYALAEQGAIQLADYFREQIRQREASPGNDLISKLLSLSSEEDSLTEDEVVGTSMLFLFGGHETTTNLLGNGVRALLQHPEQLELLRNSPDLIDSAIEEILRYDGPTGASVRIVKESHDFNGRPFEVGQRVFCMINAANHDHRAFPNPEVFDIRRDPNLHLTFNFGPHFCMGAPLARMEGQYAIQRIVEQLPGLTLAAENYEYMDTLVMRGVREMPVSL